MNQWLGAPPPPPPPPPGDGAGALEPVTVSVAVLLVVEPAALLTTTAQTSSPRCGSSIWGAGSGSISRIEGCSQIGGVNAALRWCARGVGAGGPVSRRR